VHVTLRSAFRPLRSKFVFPTVCLAIGAVNRRAPKRFRVVHFSVQFDHIHFIVEAAHGRALSAGVRGLSITIARRVNALAGRRGKFWADRWHGRALSTPREVRSAIVYVLGNFRRHSRATPAKLDRYSSALDFAWFRELHGRTARQVAEGSPGGLAAFTLSRAPPGPVAIVSAATWLLAVGWRRRGGISLHDAAHP
jgi:REP element-mobilizing transposase RayT